MAHLLAISGLHMGLVTGFVFFLLRAVMALLPPLALRWPIKKFAALGALAAAATYLALSGAAAPAERAFVMVTVALVAVVLDRVALSLRSLALPAVVVLALSPAALLGPSFQMSFAAAIALVALFEGPWTARLRRRGEELSGLTAIARYGLMVAVSSLIAGLATAPFVAYHFHAVSVVGVLANLLAVPLTALWIMPAGVLALAVMPLGGDGPILDAMGWGIAAVLWWAETIAAWPRAQVTVGALGGDGLILFALGALWALLWRGRRR
ncbi:MAG: ComEC/Rec2 family competence protein [Pseudomonadota bacterium]|nr:ComEC/Rec2 family competence protein [Pseudomonadota bacterium]